MSEVGLTFYVWLIGGLALCAAETFVPGAFLIWIGLAGLAVGAIDYFFPMTLAAQALVFAGFVVLLVTLGRRAYGSLDKVGPSLPSSRAHAMIGREYFLDAAIERGFGSMRVDDSVWRVAGPDLPAGTKVRVVAVEDGVAMRVEKA